MGVFIILVIPVYVAFDTKNAFLGLLTFLLISIPAFVVDGLENTGKTSPDQNKLLSFLAAFLTAFGIIYPVFGNSLGDSLLAGLAALFGTILGSQIRESRGR
ncbi:hypothetical protein ACFFLM_11690 [Deinococcus oregonensis]|uniref:Uncharacterized protein n=1 Tax=Deinococcus oregonensis TaxID=1805970 RepID=A0ABV6B0W9_9DEIO